MPGEIDNMVHVAKISKTGELHFSRAKIVLGKVRAEALKQQKRSRPNTKDGIEKISRAIGDDPANPLLCVKRDRGFADGGKKGEIATNPQDVDAIVKGAWRVTYDGMVGCMETAIDSFFDQNRQRHPRTKRVQQHRH